MKTVIIGDVHGCDKALNRLLGKVQIGDNDRLIMLGDLFDRGAESWEVLQTVQMLADDMGERFVLLRGNHEDYLLQPKLTFLQRLTWDRVGRGATVKSFKAHGEKMEDAAQWLKEHCQLFWRGNDFQCVHAGLKVDPIEVNDTNTLIHDHEIVLTNRYRVPLTIVGHIALNDPTWFAGDGKTTQKLSYFGWYELPKTGVICIDTGSGKGGKLTAMIIEGDSYRLESV